MKTSKWNIGSFIRKAQMFGTGLSILPILLSTQAAFAANDVTMTTVNEAVYDEVTAVPEEETGLPAGTQNLSEEETGLSASARDLLEEEIAWSDSEEDLFLEEDWFTADTDRLEEKTGWLEEEPEWLEGEPDWFEGETGWFEEETEWLEGETGWSEEQTEGFVLEELEESPVTEELPTAMADPANTLIITTYDRLKNNGKFTDIAAIVGCPLPYGVTDLDWRLNGEEQLGNIITDIYWEIYNEETHKWERINTGKFPDVKCRCVLRLSMSESQGDILVYKNSSGRKCARIIFKGLPESLIWQGTGDSNNNMLFESDPFYPEEPEYSFTINLKGNVPDKYSEPISVHDEIAALKLEPASKADQDDMNEKGIQLKEAYWFKDSASTENWESLPHLKAGDFFEAGNYYLAVRLSCSNPKYRLDDIWTNIKVNDYSVSNRSKILPDGSLLVAEKYEVKKLGTKDGVIYQVLDAKAKTAAAIGVDDATLPENVVIPAQLDFFGGPYTVVELNRTFKNSKVVSVQIPATIERLKGNDELSEGLFGGCWHLQSVTFAEKSKIEKLGDNCFDGCSSLKQVTLPGSLRQIDDSAFYDCRQLERITIPASVEKIGVYSFAYCEKMKEVIIPENSKLREIKNRAFTYCDDLSEIEVPASVETIGERAFAKCISLSKVSFAKGSAIKTIEKEAFGCETGNLPILLTCVEGDAAAKTVVESYIAWAEGKGWFHVTTNLLLDIGSGITSAVKDQVCTGKALTPKITVTYSGKTLTAGTDYILVLSGNVNVGTATITIKGKGAYGGTIKKTFDIIPKGTKILKLKKGKKKATVTWKKQKVQTDGYEIQYSLKKKFNSKAKIKKVAGASKKSVTIKKLKAGKKYYVRIRTWKKVGGRKYYSAWSKVKTVKVS